MGEEVRGCALEGDGICTWLWAVQCVYAGFVATLVACCRIGWNGLKELYWMRAVVGAAMCYLSLYSFRRFYGCGRSGYALPARWFGHGDWIASAGYLGVRRL